MNVFVNVLKGRCQGYSPLTLAKIGIILCIFYFLLNPKRKAIILFLTQSCCYHMHERPRGSNQEMFKPKCQAAHHTTTQQSQDVVG